jgi:hypothetical protein
MNALEILQSLKRVGISLQVDGESLRIAGPSSLLTRELIAQIRPF